MKPNELNRILANHRLWIESNGKKGTCADLTCANLKCADLKGAWLKGAVLDNADLTKANLKDADLTDAILGKADLTSANLENADLTDAELSYANLINANLRGANLKGANLEYAHFEGAHFEGANLKCADLRNANLGFTNLEGANLRCADLRGAKLQNAILPPSLDNLPEGELIGYKRVKDYIVKLQILADSKRSRSTADKCRCDRALVLAIENEDGTDSGLAKIVNYRFTPTTYEVGEIVCADSWDEDRWAECTHGIHFFLDRKMAVDW